MKEVIPPAISRVLGLLKKHNYQTINNSYYVYSVYQSCPLSFLAKQQGEMISDAGVCFGFADKLLGLTSNERRIIVQAADGRELDLPLVAAVRERLLELAE